MSRRRLTSVAAEAVAPAPPERAGPLLTIHPNDVFSLTGARLALRLSATTFKRERREGRLRVASRGGKRFILGAWLLQWLEGGELPRESGALTNGRAGSNGSSEK